MSGHNRGSDAELCYASVELDARKAERSAAFTGIPLQSDKRQRRTRGSSDDDEEKVLPDNLLDEDFRAGGPSLCPAPVVGSGLRTSLSHLDILQDDTNRAEIYGILRRWEVDVKETGVCLHQSRLYLEDEPVPTLLIIARRHQLDSSWLRACQEIRTLLSSKGLSEISVEIAEPRVLKPRRCFPVRRNDAIFRVWDEVRNTILRELDLKDWKILECFRLGTADNDLGNPPTVMVTVDRDSTRKWKPVREDIVQILKRFGMRKVAVSIGKGRVYRLADDLDTTVPTSTWGEKAQLGVSLGNFESTHASASFGGFIEMLSPKGKWHRFGLTCYHAVLPDIATLDPTEKQQLGSWHANGINVGDRDAKSLLRVEQPSREDLNKELARIGSYISSISRKKGDFESARAILARGEPLFGPQKVHYENSKGDLERLTDLMETMRNFGRGGDSLLGHVFAGSGYRIISTGGYNRHMDWAIIKMEKSRLGGNKIDSYGTPKFNLRDGNLFETKIPHHDEQMFKLGRTTEGTSGRYSGLKVAHIGSTADRQGNVTSIVTTEHAITGDKSFFSLPGDSGALVFNRNLRVIGLLFGGSQNNHVSYITLTADLFEDIERTTGAVDVRIPM